MIELECGFCGISFTKLLKHVTAARKNGQTIFYCCISCAKKTEIVKDVCHNCGVQIEMRKSVRRSKSGFYYCSRSCSNGKNNTIYRSKENHPNWTGGKSSYRHGRELTKCSECGETRYYLLTVNHKDGDRLNNTPENLEDLCANCHITRHLVIKDGRLVIRWGMMTSDEAKILMESLGSCSCLKSPTILNVRP